MTVVKLLTKMETKKIIYSIGIILLIILVSGFIGYTIKKPEFIKEFIKVSIPSDQINSVTLSQPGQDNELFISLRGSLYEKSETMNIWAAVYNSSGKIIDSSCNLDIVFPNTSKYIIKDEMTQFELGHHNYSISAPPSTSGTYFISVNCTRTSDGVWAMTDGELQIEVGFIQRIRNIFSSNFKVTSLTSSTPIFSNEEIKILTTFALFDGNVTPDTINLTILDPNDNVYVSVSKSDFTMNNQNVWVYSKSVGSSPTTGRYSVFIIAEKDGYSDSSTSSFRVTVGGPFKFVVSGDTRICVQEIYNPRVNVTNEGEGEVETNIFVWLDLNGDNIINTDEAQGSISKQVPVYGMFDEPVSFLVPTDTTPLGSVIVRAKAVYVGGSHPDGTSSFTAEVIDCPRVTAEGRLGGGRTLGITGPSTITNVKEVIINNKIIICVLLFIILLLLIFMGVHRIIISKVNPLILIIIAIIVIIIYCLIRWGVI